MPGGGPRRKKVAEQDAEYTRKPVTCDKCGRLWWVDYSTAQTAMLNGKMWIKSRQVRKGEVDNGGPLAIPGQFEEEHYLAGTCEVCDIGLVKPSAEAEMKMILDRKAHFLAVGVDPELAFDYARAEYEEAYNATFNPAFAEWWATIGWALADNPFAGALENLPPHMLGEERGLENGSPKCPHVSNQYGPLPWLR